METLRDIVEALIRLFQREVHERAVLVPLDDVHEIKSPPSLILQGPALAENRCRRVQAFEVCKDLDRLTYERWPAPRLYHLDFDIVATTANDAQLLDLQAKITRFYLDHPVLAIEDRGALNLTELVPMESLRRVNLSNLKQSAGRLRIEDCPIYGNAVEEGRLIVDRHFEFRGGLVEDRRFTSQPEESP